MRKAIARIVVSCTLIAGCGEDVDQATTAAKGLMEVANQAKKMGEAADEAAKQAEKKALEEAPEGASEEEKKQFVDQAKALAALQAMGKASGDAAAVVNWRALQPFLPETLAGYAAEKDVDGRTNKTGGFKVTVVKRRYKRDKERVVVSITDTSMSPMLRAPFAMAAIIEEDSSDGYKKGSKIEGHTTLLEWRKASKRSKATLLAAERFLVDVKVTGTDKDDAAVQVLKGIDLEGLSKVKTEAPAKDEG
ncbi:MAG: hypothetical protein OXU20_34555 [Myxococcales bacterium]|nr:hypothetical protein [Myxococcales bacterium]MDD9968568.1 hypothetical protein [Myxococcales bacterium]